jgi:hypothetical protein
VWRKPDGTPVESFTIITTEPNELVRPIHDRMPVILRPEDEEQWLDASRTAFAKARSLLKPYPAELMDAHDVSTVVNSAKYDGPECIRPFQMMRDFPPPASCLCCDDPVVERSNQKALPVSTSTGVLQAKLLLMEIPAGRTPRFELHPRLPELFGNEMNDTVFNLESSGDS